MPYGGTTPEQDAKIERCVEHVMAQGHDKVSAIKICKAQIMHGGKSGHDGRGRRRAK